MIPILDIPAFLKDGSCLYSSVFPAQLFIEIKDADCPKNFIVCILGITNLLYCCCVGAGLQVLRTNNLMHRDLKPQVVDFSYHALSDDLIKMLIQPF